MQFSPGRNTATSLGLLAVLLWGTVVGLIRGVSESFGPVGGAALIYTVGSVFLVLLLGFPRLRTFPRSYLIVGSLLFVAYEICLSLSLGFAANRGQAIELGIVNYLWPCCRWAASSGWSADPAGCRGSAPSRTFPAIP
jgi:drug/metabolite transporter (DMT)-like permease